MPAIPEARAGAWIGRVIDDRYRIVEVLGEGGMGAVYVAEHLKLRKQVALKTIRTEFADDAHLTERFVREALATGQIEHPHVVSAMDFGHLPEGGAYLVVQLVRGESLTAHLRRGPLAWPQVAELGAQIADALAAAHLAGIVHRDLKPDNILLEQRDGLLWAKVVDFGIARLSGDGAAVVTTGTEPLTRAGMVVGTPGYMAPEQALAGQVDGRTDLYALGVILWEACTGRRLWTGDSLTELFQRQLTTAPPDLRAAAPGVPPALIALIVQLLDPAPAKRPATPALVRDELRSIARGEDLAAASMRRPMPGVPAMQTMVANVMTGEQPPPTLHAGGPWSLALDLRTAVTRNLPPYEGAGRRVWWALGGGVLVALLLLARCACGGEHTAAPTEAVAVGKPPVAADDPPSKPAPAPDPPPETPIPAAYAPHAEILAHDKDRKARKLSAEKVAGASESDKQSIPLYIRNLAWLEKNSGCEAKKAVLLKIESDGDPRVIPALRIVAAYPKDGCGFFGMKDCLDCLRDDLQRVLGHFESTHPE